jgi:hypothetical protein
MIVGAIAVFQVSRDGTALFGAALQAAAPARVDRAKTSRVKRTLVGPARGRDRAVSRSDRVAQRSLSHAAHVNARAYAFDRHRLSSVGTEQRPQSVHTGWRDRNRSVAGPPPDPIELKKADRQTCSERPGNVELALAPVQAATHKRPALPSQLLEVDPNPS